MNQNKWLAYLLDEEKEEPKYKPDLSLLSENIFDNLDLVTEHLNESELQILMEGRRENILKKYGSSIDDGVLEKLFNFDEQYKYKHAIWMAKQLSKIENGYDQEEEIETLIAAVEDFVRYQPNLKRKDINQYDSTEDLVSSIYEDVVGRRIKKAKKERSKDKLGASLSAGGESTVVYEDDRFFVVRPNSQEASCHFGRKTKWCIAQEYNPYYDDYTQAGKAFYFIKDDSKTNEDLGYKIALEVTYNGDEVIYENLWDRFDDNVDLHSAYTPGQVADALQEEPFNIPAEAADQIAEAIAEHAEDNPLDTAIRDLINRINNGDMDDGWVSFIATEYDGEGTYELRTEASCFIKLENPKFIEFLEEKYKNKEFNYLNELEEELRAEFEDSGEIFEKIDNEVDISSSRYNLSGVDTFEFVREGETRHLVRIDFIFDLNEYNNTFNYQDDPSGIESFCETIAEEWGSRNQSEIEEVINNVLPRAVPEFMKMYAANTGFFQFKQEFEDGVHQVDDNIFYTIDDDEDEYSDLNIHLRFNFALDPDYVDYLFAAHEVLMDPALIHAAGRTLKDDPDRKEVAVKIAGVNQFSAQRKLQQDFKFGRISKGLEQAVYNVYSNARDAAFKQLSLDFGKQYPESEIEFPELPEELTPKISFTEESQNAFRKSKENMIPGNMAMTLGYDIYVPFTKSQAEMTMIKYFFNFIQKNYDEIRSYIYKFIQREVEVTSKAKNPKALKENLYLEILESSLFISELNKEMILLEKRKKRKQQKGKRRAAKTAKRKKKKKSSGKKDACYYKVKSRYSVWPSAYASGALVKCRKVGAKNWGNSTKEGIELEIELGDDLLQEVRSLLDEKKKRRKKKKAGTESSKETSLRDWFKRKGAPGKKGGWVDCNTCRKDKKTGRKKCKPCGRKPGEKRSKYPSCRPTPGACGERGRGRSWGKKSAKGKK